MSLLFTFNGINVIATPSAPLPTAIDFTITDYVAPSTNPFTGSQQIVDWQASLVSMNVTLPPMKRQYGAIWSAFFMEARGGVNAFMLGDASATLPQGSNLTTGANALVNGANQTGYAFNSKGWQVSTNGLLLPGDWIQIGYRLHKVLDAVNSDLNGDAVINIYPQLRESPADGLALITKNCQGLYRMASSVNKFSISEAEIYGFQFSVREAI